MDWFFEMKAFFDLQRYNPISPSAQALWHALMYLNNGCAVKVEQKWYWRVEFTVANKTLLSLVDFSVTQLDRMRNELIQKGRIRYKKGRGNQCGTYSIIPFATHYVEQSVNQTDKQTVVQVWVQTDTNSGTLINNNIYSPNGNSFLVVGDDACADARGREPPGNEAVLSDYLEDINIYFGMTEKFKAEVTGFTEKLFTQYFARQPTQQDIIQLFHHVRESTQTAESWKVSLGTDKIDVAEYAFEVAAASNVCTWNYLNGIFAKIAQRGLKTRDDCEAYDFERDCRKGKN